MKRWVVSLLVVAIALALCAGMVQAAPGQEFRLGFKALAEQIPDVVGQPVEEEHYGPNGDSLQRTTTGLMVWRKADNWTAFTNGSRTWVNGPTGVAERGNDDRFAWEGQAPVEPQNPAPTPSAPSAPVPVSAPAPVPTPQPAPAAQPAPSAPVAASLLWSIDNPREGMGITSQTTTVKGWVVDPRAEGQPWNGIDQFEAYVDGPKDGGGRRLDVLSISRSERPDVAAAMSKPAYANSGFSVVVSWNGVPLGAHALHLYAHSAASGWGSKVINLDLRGGMETINLKSSDLPSGYVQAGSGWDNGSHLSVFETSLVQKGPAVVYSDLTIVKDAAEARSIVEMAGAGATGIAQIRVRSSSASKGYEVAQPVRAGSPWVGFKMVIYSVGNVVGRVYVAGNAEVSTLSQAAGVADRIASRLAGTAVPEGPGFQFINR